MKFITKALYRYYISKRPDQIKASELTFVGMDENGKRYYSWDELDKVPKCRVDELQNLSLMDEMKLTKDQVFALCFAIIENNEKTLAEKDQKKAVMMRSQIDFLANEIMWRAENLTPTDLILEMASVVCVREDEAPDQFTVRIQDEKVKQFKAESQNGNFFFVESKLFNTLKPSLVMSGEEFKKHWNNLIQQELHNERRLATILQEKSSESENKATTK
jgi:hypothetical protein